MTSEAGFTSSDQLGASAAVNGSPWVVLKFGGSSVATADNWHRIAGLVRNRLDAGLRPVIVHSALAGISNLLVALLDRAVTGEAGSEEEEIVTCHRQLATDLGLDANALLAEYFHELEQLTAGIRLVREVSVRVRVRVMALGELMATTLGAAFLQDRGLPVVWQDARDLLTSSGRGGHPRPRDYLAATCGTQPDPDLRARLDAAAPVILTQGFIARNGRGETVLLGRGGSDTSAAYLAARLQACRLEIWTDMPGMFTADPRRIPSARLLVALRYDEAQELASAGSSILHPRCLSPLRADGIPLFVRSTADPQIAGTVIAAVTAEAEPQVKGICIRNGLTLVSMDSVGMWHEVGFLARAFAVFSEHGVSVDLVSTSETNVTVSIDTGDDDLPLDVRDALVADLEALCRVRVIDDCSAVSLVGRKIRTILSRLAPALEVFEEEKIHLMSQAANDLNLTFVVDREQGLRLVRKLHSSIIRKSGGSPAFGPRWEELFAADDVLPAVEPPWWQRRRDELLAIAAQHDNAYVYDRTSVLDAARGLLDLQNVDRVLYAVKANFNVELLRALAGQGVDFECVSPGEVDWLERAVPDLTPDRILFTPNFAPRSEYAWALDKGLTVTLDNLYPLEAWADLFAGARLFIRLDPGQGRGHHEHVKTAGVHSKFGVPLFEIDQLATLLDRAGATVIGVHAHSGSGILDASSWQGVAMTLVEVAERFPETEVIDLGGGFGIPEKPGDRPLDLDQVDMSLADIRRAYPDYRYWIEPGRFLVARAGVLLTHVTQTKGKGDMRYVGVATGMNSLIRPALYGSYHEIVNLTRLGEPPSDSVTIVGPICETGDRLGSDRLLPPTTEGDVILVANAGAYGFVMASGYNRRPIATEVVI